MKSARPCCECGKASPQVTIRTFVSGEMSRTSSTGRHNLAPTGVVTMKDCADILAVDSAPSRLVNRQPARRGKDHHRRLAGP